MNSEKTIETAVSKTRETFKDLASLPKTFLNHIERHSQLMVIVCADSEKIMFVSSAIQSLLGYEKSDLIGLPWYKFILPEYAKCLKKYYYKSIEPDVKKVFNVPVHHKEGRYVMVECTIIKVIEDGEYFLCYLKKANHHNKEHDDLMIQSEKMAVAGQLAAGIAHEIRNPLTSIKGFLQLLQAGVNQKEVYYKIMSDEIDKIEAITSELLFLARPMTNKKKIESVNSMVKDVLLLLSSQARLSNIHFKWQPAKEYFIYCDRSQFKQVLINLVKNAIEATETNGEIEISVREKHPFIEIDVKDEGPGIPIEILDKIGHPFFTTKQGGTGLGIMITKRILEQHYGHLSIIPSEEKGTTFRVKVPMNPHDSL